MDFSMSPHAFDLFEWFESYLVALAGSSAVASGTIRFCDGKLGSIRPKATPESLHSNDRQTGGLAFVAVTLGRSAVSVRLLLLWNA